MSNVKSSVRGYRMVKAITYAYLQNAVPILRVGGQTLCGDHGWLVSRTAGIQHRRGHELPHWLKHAKLRPTTRESGRARLDRTLTQRALCMRVTDWLSGLVLAAWLLLEVVLRRGDEARSWQGGDADRSSTRLVVLAYVVAFVGPLVLSTSGIGVTRTGSALAWIGVTVGVVGLGVRVWSMRVLGRDYTRSLRTREAQAVIDRGPYRLVRHPGYIGSILVWVGSRLAVNWLIAVATALVLLLVYAYRINAEEEMLADHFGDAYEAYQARTWRLVPFVW